MEYQVVQSRDELRDIVLNARRNANLNHLDVSQITDMSCLFEDSRFNGDISLWDVSNVTTMEAMFRDSEFNGDLSRWNVGNVVDMRFMFRDSKFSGDISLWNVSYVKDMFSMFANTSYVGDLSSWTIQEGCLLKWWFRSWSPQDPTLLKIPTLPQSPLYLFGAVSKERMIEWLRAEPLGYYHWVAAAELPQRSQEFLPPEAFDVFQSNFSMLTTLNLKPHECANYFMNMLTPNRSAAIEFEQDTAAFIFGNLHEN